MSNRRDHTLGAVFAVLSALGFAGKAIFIKILYTRASLDAVTLLALRMIFSAPFFAWIGWWNSRRDDTKPLTGKEWGAIAGMAFLGYYLSAFLDFFGLQFISAGLERIILFTFPTWTVLLSAWFLKRPITKRALFALALSTGGIALTFWHDMQVSNASDQLWTGGLLVLAASFTYSIYLILSGKVIARVGSTRFTAVVVLIATVFVMAHFFATRNASLLVQPAYVYWMCLALALFSTVLPIIFLVAALRRVTAGTVAIASSIGPPLTILMAAVFLGEPATLTQLAGAAFVLAGVGLITKTPAA